MNKERISYVAKNEKEFENLKERMNLFLKNYNLQFGSKGINVEE